MVDAVKVDYLDFDDVLGRFEKMMDWLAGVYVNAMNVIHYMHDKYAYERLEMAFTITPPANHGLRHGRHVRGCRQPFGDTVCESSGDSR